MENKTSAIYVQSGRVDKVALDGHASIESIRQAMKEFIEQPSEETATLMDSEFSKLSTVVEAYRNAITRLANIIFSDDGTIDDIDVIIRDDGSFEL